MIAPQDTATDRASASVGAPLRIGDQFVWSREVPAEWEARLRDVSPRSDEVSWLHLVWEPGELWVPGQRWVLYEMIHPRWADPGLVATLRGPNPRLAGHYCTADSRLPNQFRCLCRRKLEAWKGSNNPGITLMQWRLFRETGYVASAVPFLVLQGPKGAHRLRYSEFEQELLALAGKPTEPPTFGTLPYAPFDERTIALITQHNRLLQMQVSLAEFRRRMTTHYAAERAEMERELRRQMVHHLDAEMTEPGDLFVKAADRGEMDGQRRTNIDYVRYAEQAIPQFIETGVLPHHTQVQ